MCIRDSPLKTFGDFYEGVMWSTLPSDEDLEWQKSNKISPMNTDVYRPEYLSEIWESHTWGNPWTVPQKSKEDLLDHHSRQWFVFPSKSEILKYKLVPAWTQVALEQTEMLTAEDVRDIHRMKIKAFHARFHNDVKARLFLTEARDLFLKQETLEAKELGYVPLSSGDHEFERVLILGSVQGNNELTKVHFALAHNWPWVTDYNTGKSERKARWSGTPNKERIDKAYAHGGTIFIKWNDLHAQWDDGRKFHIPDYMDWEPHEFWISMEGTYYSRESFEWYSQEEFHTWAWGKPDQDYYHKLRIPLKSMWENKECSILGCQITLRQYPLNTVGHTYYHRSESSYGTTWNPFLLPPAHRLDGLDPPCDYRNPRAPDEMREPVSYTHLTLPTICSV